MRLSARHWHYSLGFLALVCLIVPLLPVVPIEYTQETPPINQVALTSVPEQYQEGVQAYRNGEYSLAVTRMRQVLSKRANDTNARYYLAVCLDLLKQHQEALGHYQAVLETDAEPKIKNYARQRVSVLATAIPVSPLQGLPGLPSLQAVSGKGIVPLKHSKNALMVEATLTNAKTGKQVHGTFILDTGATYTSISQEMAETLGLDLENTDKVHITTANGKIDVPKVMIDKLQVEGVEAKGVQATVIQVRPDSSFSGLLGLSFIRQFKMTIDPVANQLVFESNTP